MDRKGSGRWSLSICCLEEMIWEVLWVLVGVEGYTDCFLFAFSFGLYILFLHGEQVQILNIWNLLRKKVH